MGGSYISPPVKEMRPVEREALVSIRSLKEPWSK